MDKNFCRQIDKQFLVEDYVAGKLKGELLNKFEQHISQCEKHARAVALEKAMIKGITEFARGEIKAKLRERLKKKADMRLMFLRYAAILFVAVITPLLIYYQFYIAPDKLSLPTPPKGAHEQKAPGDSISSENYLSAKPKSEMKTSAPVQDQTMLAKKENLKIDNAEEREKAEIISDTPESISPLPVEEAESAAENQMEEKSNLPRIAAQDIADKPETAIGTRSAIGAAGVPRKMAITSNKDTESLQTEINSRVVRDSVQLKTCMKTYLSGEQLDTFAISLKLTILRSGEIGKIEILNATTRSDKLEECLSTVVKNWLAAPDEKQSTIEIKISYK